MKMTLPFRPVYLLGVILASLLCSFVSAQQPSSTLVNDPAMADESQGENWLAFGRTYSEQRFSPLTQINQSNVGGLELEWYVDLPNSRSLVSTPLVVDGIMYFISSMNIVRAVDATSGEELWRYDPQVAQYASRRMRAGWDNSRGIGIWEDKVFVATWDGRLIGIDRNDGRELWSVQTIDPELAMYITGAPKIRAMQIIEELEPVRRSLYCGSVGYLGCEGQMDFNIAIRSLVCHADRIHCWGGGGIVADSIMELEYQETLTKVGNLLNTLQPACPT